MTKIKTNIQALMCIAGLSGTYRDEPIDEYLQSLWDAAGGDDASSEHMIEIGNSMHEKPAPFTDELSCAMALAVRLLDNGPIDIEVAHRTVGNVRYGRAEICGPGDDACGKAATPCLALIVATLHAVDARASRSGQPT